MKDLQLLAFISGLLNLLMFIYILFVIPLRLKKIKKNQDVISKNQNVIENLVKKVGGIID